MLVITGASGQLGRATAELVLEQVRDPSGVLLVTRNPAALAGLGRGVQVRSADFDEPAGLRQAFAGGTRLLLISTDRVDGRGKQHACAIDAARDAGVGHIVYTSMIAPGPANPALISPSHWATEQHLRESGPAWTILRCGLYADFQVMEAIDALASGRLVHNRGGGRCAYLARADCARAAAAVLTGDGHASAVYELTGPDSLDAKELCELYSDIGGSAVEPAPVDDAELFRRIGGDSAADGHVRYGAALVVSLGQAIRAGRFDNCTTTVHEIAGGSTASVREVLLRNRDALRAAAFGAPRPDQ